MKPSEVRPDDVFGRLRVRAIRREYRCGKNRPVAECECECGGTAFPLVHNLVSGRTTSCGCRGGALERAERKRRGEPLPRIVGQFYGQMEVYMAWKTGRLIGRGARPRSEVRLDLVCPGCLRHVEMEIAEAERRRPQSCGCLGGKRYMTIEERADRRHSYYLTAKELREEREDVLRLTGREGRFETARGKPVNGILPKPEVGRE